MSDKVKVQAVVHDGDTPYSAQDPDAILFEVAEGPEWSKVFPHDREDAANVRQALADLGFYPTADLGEDPDYAMAQTNYRAALHQVVEELDRTDLQAVFQLARPLMLVPRDPAIFDYVAERDARFRCLLATIPTV
jgi:hypothetical protein